MKRGTCCIEKKRYKISPLRSLSGHAVLLYVMHVHVVYSTIHVVSCITFSIPRKKEVHIIWRV